MKRWQSILISLGLMLAAGYAQQIPDENLRKATQAVIAGVGLQVVNKTSQSNPDGTKAETPYVKPADKPAFDENLYQ